MQLISCHDGKLLRLRAGDRHEGTEKRFFTGMQELDTLLPGGGFARAGVHELLSEARGPKPFFFATLLARASLGLGSTSAHLIWCDPLGELYPPALAAQGIPLERLFLLKTRTDEELVWTIAECLRCKGVGVVIASPPRLSRIQARRLQLAAERGGGIGLLMRSTRGHASDGHAAATRWRVCPAPGERTLQRWNVQLVHGHGGRVGKSVILECNRETNRITARLAAMDPVREAAELAHRPAAALAG